MNEPTHTERRLELVATVLLTLATVATAWSGYQARQWTGEQSQSYAHATAARLESNRAAERADSQAQVDVATFIQWVDAFAQNDRDLAGFYRDRFRDEFTPAFDAWLATAPLKTPNAPPTPFVLPEYRLAAAVESARLETQAGGFADEASAANERANNYMLAVVLFASALFFAGISTKLRTTGARTAILGLGCLLFSATVIWLATFPVQLST